MTSERRRRAPTEMTEKEKMLAGELYDPLDPELVAARERAATCVRTSTHTREPTRSGGDSA